jgi:hypothetical protein
MPAGYFIIRLAYMSTIKAFCDGYQDFLLLEGGSFETLNPAQ